jgi:hypothetical protein
VKEALIAPGGTVTDAGTVTEELLLASETVNPAPAAVPLRLTRHESIPAAEYDCVVQVNPLSEGTPAPLMLIVAAPWAALLVIVTIPVKELV